MSSGAAGKFQDHYVTLGVETNSDSETIQAAYSKLAQKYHPNNPEFGDKDRFDSVNMAFEVLSDPTLRASFDKVKGAVEDTAGKLTGDKKLQAEGKFDKAKGAAHDAAGDVKDAFRNATKTP